MRDSRQRYEDNFPGGVHLQVTILENIPSDPALIASWNALALRMERPEVFYTYQWAAAAGQAFAGAVRPLLCLVHDETSLCGIAALAIGLESPDNVFFLTASTADYCDVLSNPDARPAVLTKVFYELKRRGIRKITLANVPSDSATLRALPAIAKSFGFHLHDRLGYECGVILLGSSDDRESLLRSVQKKQREKRGLKKLAELGPVRLSHGTRDDLQTDLRSIFSAQVARFLATERISPLLQPSRNLFLTDVAQRLSDAGWLRITRLEVNGEGIAWNFGFRFADGWFWYLPTFQMQYEYASPGSCLLRLLVEETCQDPEIDRLDLGLGDESYKQRFANSSNQTRHIELSADFARHLFGVGRIWVASRAKKTPALENRLRIGRNRARAMAARIRKDGVSAALGYAVGRASRVLNSNDEVLMFESSSQAPDPTRPSVEESTTAILVLLDWQQLAAAALSNSEDLETLRYLMRCAARMGRRGAQGYMLRTKNTPFAHLLWVADFEGFHLSEIDYTMSSADLGSRTPSTQLTGPPAMIFDCWTPSAERGHGNYPAALRAVMRLLAVQQRPAWIFSAATNRASTRGILDAGFIYRFSLIRKRRVSQSRVILRHRNDVININVPTD